MNLKLAELLESVPNDYKEMARLNCAKSLSKEKKEIIISWYSNGQPCEIAYWESGQRHRPTIEGPALQSWNRNGQQVRISYYENGKEVKIK